ncbi:N-terminal acetyltransferase A complex auxiliary subunit NAA15-like [Eucalyptus grandis]|uniref:N-terminal acetyltransferase A complex auxiliary subunit NAA15-like n=1 Tax=Eucalyptus grandis TaxID=71139 RepID=UPI00052685F7|nr:N-terminal acetyltransferase A complex auxiliary subunit NAA15-like [Eucalyptus grandis]
MAAPTTDSEKLICTVLEAERPEISHLHGKSLLEANESFLDKHKDSLMHRAAAAEMLYLLEPSNKGKAVKLIEDSSNNLVQRNGALGSFKEWKLKDCIAVHKLLSSVVVDMDAASRWKLRCAEYFLHSTYFEGSRSSAVLKSSYNQISSNPENGVNHPAGGISMDSLAPNGKLEAFKDLSIQQVELKAYFGQCNSTFIGMHES